MKFQRPATLLAASAAALALVLTGCSSGSSTPAASSGTALAATQTINVWGWAGAPGADTMNDVIAAYEKANPNITVKYTEISTDDYKNKASLALSSGEPIDVVGVQPNAWAAANESYLTPVDQWDGGTDLLTKYQPNTIDQEKKLFDDGVIRSVPFGSSGSAVGFYNVDILKQAGLTEAPKTWADFQKLSDALKGTDIVPAVMPSDSWFQDEFVLTMAGEEDPSFFNNVRYNNASWDDPAYVNALNEYKALYDNGTLDKTTLDLPYSDATALFDSGKAAVLFNGSWEAGRLLSSYRSTNNVQASDVGAMAVPTSSSGTASTRAFLDITYGIPTASTHKAAAEDFIKYATTGDGVNIWATKLGFVPALQGWTLPAGTLTTPVETQGYELLQSLIANPSSDRNNLSNFSAQVGTYVLNVVNGTMTAQQAATQGQADLTSGKYN